MKPEEFDAEIKKAADTYGLSADALRQEVQRELLARVAQEVVKDLMMSARPATPVTW